MLGVLLEFYDATATNGTTIPQSTHTITSNTANTIVITPAISSDITLADGDFIHIRGYGAPCVCIPPVQLRDSMPIIG